MKYMPSFSCDRVAGVCGTCADDLRTGVERWILACVEWAFSAKAHRSCHATNMQEI